MGINPVALLAHQLDLKGLLQLIHRLPPVAGQSWEYLEQPPASETLNGLWNKVEKVSFGSPECALDIGPRSAALHFFAKMGGTIWSSGNLSSASSRRLPERWDRLRRRWSPTVDMS